MESKFSKIMNGLCEELNAVAPNECAWEEAHVAHAMTWLPNGNIIISHFYSPSPHPHSLYSPTKHHSKYFLN